MVFVGIHLGKLEEDFADLGCSPSFMGDKKGER